MTAVPACSLSSPEVLAAGQTAVPPSQSIQISSVFEEGVSIARVRERKPKGMLTVTAPMLVRLTAKTLDPIKPPGPTPCAEKDRKMKQRLPMRNDRFIL